MRSATCALLLSTVFLPAAAPPAFASWAPVPLEVLVDEADLIVAGKVTRIQDGGFAIGPRKYDVAVVEVTAVLKSLSGKPRQARIAQPAAGGLALSTDILFQPGQQAVWLLTRDPDRNVSWARHPFQIQDVKNQDQLARLIAAREKLPGGKPVNGLTARAELVKPGADQEPGAHHIRFSLKNVSAQPITVCEYAGNQPLQVTWLAPDGKKLESGHYAWLATADLPEMTKTSFVTLPPGGVRFVGPRGPYSDIVLQAPPAPEDGRAPAGKHRATVSFLSREAGQRFGLEKVWVGTVTANELPLPAR